MDEVTITEMPSEGKVRVYKISSEKEVLGHMRVIKNTYIWSRDLFAKVKIGPKVALNYLKNHNHDGE